MSETAGITGYFEDFVIEVQPKATRRCDVRMLSYFFAGPKHLHDGNVMESKTSQVDEILEEISTIIAQSTS